MALQTSFATEIQGVKVRMVTRLSKRGLEYDNLEFYSLDSDDNEVLLSSVYCDDNIRYKLSTLGLI